MSKFCCFNLVTLKTQVRHRQTQKRSKEIDTSKGTKKKLKKGGGREIVDLVHVKSSSSEDDSDDESEDEDAGSNYQERVSKANGNYDGSE